MKKLKYLFLIYLFLASLFLALPVFAADVKTHSTLPTGLVSYWELEEESGTRIDSTATGNDLTDNNTVLFGTGKQGNAADFELANSEYLSITDGSQTGLDLSGDLSFAFWFNFESIPAFGIQEFISKWDSGQRAYQFYYSDSPGLIKFLLNSTTPTEDQYTFSWEPSTATWYYLILTWDASASEAKFYVNNTQQGGTQTGTETNIRNTTSAFNLGHRSSGSGYVDGLMDEMGIWSKVLTTDEISDLYNSGAGIPYEEVEVVVNSQIMFVGI